MNFRPMLPEEVKALDDGDHSPAEIKHVLSVFLEKVAFGSVSKLKEASDVEPEFFRAFQEEGR